MRTAAETLERARFARGAGDVAGCLHISEATVRQAQFEHDWESAYWGAEVPGRMYMGRAEPHLAIPHYLYALDLAHLYGLKHRLGGALHDLALAKRETGDRHRFRELATEALSRYCASDPRNPCLTGLHADVAADDWERDPDNPDRAVASLHAWRAVPGCMHTPRYRLAGAAHLMVASAALNLSPCYKAGADTLDLVLSAMPDGEAVAFTLAYAARGSLAMGDFERAVTLATRAESVGIRRDEPVPAEQATAVREAAFAERAGVRC